MNLFVLDEDPVVAAISQCDAHVVKMILETSQMLSTAHRILDGNMIKSPRKHWVLPDTREEILYRCTHFNHPCNVWIRESKQNYLWAFRHLEALSQEFEHRFKKTHKSWEKLSEVLSNTPNSISDSGMTPFRLAMGAEPQCIDPRDPVGSYRKFYATKQKRFKMRWTDREIPEWFEIQ